MMRTTSLPRFLLFLLIVAACLPGCSGDPPDFDALWRDNVTRVTTGTTETLGVDGETVTHQRPHLFDGFGRYVKVHGINVSGSTKFPATEEFPSLYPLPADAALAARCRSEFPMPEGCIPAHEVSYVGKPFPLDEADKWFGDLAALGFNSIRLIMNWEAIEPNERGQYDEEYLAYFEAIVAKAREHGIYVLVDMHQDIWSRHLFAYYNEAPPAAPGSLEATVLSLFPPYTDWVRGHGAPRWAIEACMPEKDMDSPHWGMFRALGALKNPDGTGNLEAITGIVGLLGALGGDGAGGIPPWLTDVINSIPAHFDPNESTDVLPFTFWGLNGALSMDIDRGFACFYGGDKLWPKRTIRVGERDLNLKDYFQEAYVAAYLEVVKRVKKYDNVIGYDLMNEPIGVAITLTAAAAYLQSGLPETVEGLLTTLLGVELGGSASKVLFGLNMLPKVPAGATDEERQAYLAMWGLDGLDLMAALDYNMSFDGKYLQPFYERIGLAIQAEDPNAIIWFEPGMSLRTYLGASPQWDQPLTRPQGIRQMVFAPHWYPDIYPFIGFNSASREFNEDEWLYRDFTEPLAEFVDRSPAWLGNIPVVFGEFGTYFNYGGIEASRAQNYRISATLLDRYYEAFESLGIGKMLWCFSPENSYALGDGWDKEDFSIIDPDGNPRAWPAYVRPYARAASGKVLEERFYSQYHFHDPEKGTPDPERDFVLRMESKESDAPTEVFVPRRQYPDGFYVWLSDGLAYYDDARQMLYWYPTRDEPDAEHVLRIAPSFTDREARDWSYFFRGTDVVNGKGGVR